MSIQEQGMGLAAAADNAPTAASRTRDGSTVTLRLKVESLGVTFHTGAHVTFSYTAPHTGSLVPVDGTLDEFRRAVPIPNGPPQPTILIVDGLRHAVPPGTLVTIQTGEIR